MSKKCDICGDELRDRFPKVLDPITKETFAIHECPTCGLGYTLPTPEDFNRYYGKPYYGKRHGFTARYCTRRRLRLVTSTIGEPSGKRLLDVGCGDGSFLLAAKLKGWRVMGVERRPSVARAAGLEIKETVEQISKAESFDCITLWHTLEHMPRFRPTLSRLSEFLAPDGVLLIALPDNAGLQARVFKGKWFHLDVPRHLFHFNADSLELGLKDAGFVIQRRWHQEFEYDLMGWVQSALNCVFPSPNAFFNHLTGKRADSRAFERVVDLLAGALVATLCLPLLPLGTLLGRGATLVVLARREGEKEREDRRQRTEDRGEERV